MRLLTTSAGLAVLAALAGLGACSTAPAAGPGTAPSTPAPGAQEVLAVTLPGTASWRPERVAGATGGLPQQSWRAPAGPGTWCLVTLAQQPPASYPVGVMAGFDDQTQGGAVTLNRRIPGPAGSVEAVEQARTFTVNRPGGQSEVGQLRARHLLSQTGAVVSVVAAAPSRVADSCRPEAIVSSARLGMRTVGYETDPPTETGQRTDAGQGVLVLTGLGG